MKKITDNSTKYHRRYINKNWNRDLETWIKWCEKSAFTLLDTGSKTRPREQKLLILTEPTVITNLSGIN